jgi:predicted  nucleic acid-binding Zn-ribbon protein
MDAEDRKAVTERLLALNGRIKEFRDKLEHHGIYDDNHEMTEKNLKARLAEVEQEVQNRTGSGEDASTKVGWLERELEKWVVATDFDYKS